MPASTIPKGTAETPPIGASPSVPPLALTMGDPAGIGPDIAVMAWLRRHAAEVPPFVFIGDIDVLRERAWLLGADIACTAISSPRDAVGVFSNSLPVLPVSIAESINSGIPTARGAMTAQNCIEKAVSLVLAGDASAVVTNPIAKHAMAAAGFPYPGHTEFLGTLARDRGLEATPVMMLCGPDLRVVPVTIHIALSAVPATLTTELIVKTARVTAAGLRRWLGIEQPRLAVTGLNPHAGEDGLMGNEEWRIIAPALTILSADGYEVSGPHPADAMFHARARQGYDVAIAMYHDQALIPLKTLAFDEGVNVTLGLPFVRTSPDHGTAFGIAGTGRALPTSLIAALRLADTMARNGAKPATTSAIR